jgi:hypothetical protein
MREPLRLVSVPLTESWWEREFLRAIPASGPPPREFRMTYPAIWDETDFLPHPDDRDAILRELMKGDTMSMDELGEYPDGPDDGQMMSGDAVPHSCPWCLTIPAPPRHNEANGMWEIRCEHAACQAKPGTCRASAEECLRDWNEQPRTAGPRDYPMAADPLQEFRIPPRPKQTSAEQREWLMGQSVRRSLTVRQCCWLQVLAGVHLGFAACALWMAICHGRMLSMYVTASAMIFWATIAWVRLGSHRRRLLSWRQVGANTDQMQHHYFDAKRFCREAISEQSDQVSEGENHG